MTLKPIRGAPVDAPVPDFPSGGPGPLGVPASGLMHSAVEPLPSCPAPPARRIEAVEIRGVGDSILTFRCIPEIPAIHRSSMTISVSGEPTGNDSPPTMPHLNLATDKAKAFLLALRDGSGPIAVADGGTGFQVEFAMTDDGPVFIVGKPGQEDTPRRFSMGRSYDVKTMAARLLAELGP